jgi:hypothetical protein
VGAGVRAACVGGGAEDDDTEGDEMPWPLPCGEPPLTVRRGLDEKSGEWDVEEGRGVDGAVAVLPIVAAGAGARAASAGAAGAGAAAAGRTKWWFVVVPLTWKVTTNSA